MHKINPKYSYLEEFLLKIPEIFETEGEEIQHHSNVIKMFEAPDGSFVNVKRFKIPALFNRLVYSLGIRKPKGQRAWEYPQILYSKGIDTPEPMAYIEDRNCGLLGLSYFISVQCPFEHTLYEMVEAPRDLYAPLAEAVGRLAADMHEKGILHKDFTPGNILWEQNDDQSFLFSLVDINRMYFGAVSDKRGLKSLIKFWGPKEFTTILVKEYAKLRNIPEQQALDFVMSARQKFWERYRKRHRMPFNVEY